MPANRSITVKESRKPKVLFSLRVNLNKSTVAQAAGQAFAGLVDERRKKQEARCPIKIRNAKLRLKRL